MAKNKGSRIIITLECPHRGSKKKPQRKNGISHYTTTKNRRNTPNRIKLKKFCTNCNCHQIFKEIK